MSLEKARAARMASRELVKEGKNPAHERREKIKAVLNEHEAKENSFEKITLEWIEKQNERWSGDHSTAVFKSLRTNVFPFIGHEQVDIITPPMLLEVLQRIEKRGALEVARKVLQRINSVFMYAIRTGKATYKPAASLQGALKTRKVTHHAAITKEELPKFLKDLSKAKIHITTKLGMQFLILTAARSGEVRGAKLFT